MVQVQHGLYKNDPSQYVELYSLLDRDTFGGGAGGALARLIF